VNSHCSTGKISYGVTCSPRSSSRLVKDGHIFSKLILKFNQRDFFVAGDMLIEKGGYEDFVNLEKCRLNL